MQLQRPLTEEEVEEQRAWDRMPPVGREFGSPEWLLWEQVWAAIEAGGGAVIDTLKFTKTLESAGVPRELAEAHARAFCDLLTARITEAEYQERLVGPGVEPHVAEVHRKFAAAAARGVRNEEPRQ